MRIITLTTDFGELYQAEMKGVILKINPNVKIVDISHSIPPHDINAGAFALLCAAKYFPSNTIHIGVVDPEVGTARRGIVIKSASGQYFIGPDNGLLIPAAKSLGSFRVYEIPAVKDSSPTFHGRDIFAPLAGRISKGFNIEKFKLLQDYKEVNFGEAKVSSKAIEGRIIHINGFGNAITNIPGNKVKLKLGDKLKFKRHLISYVRTYADVKEGEAVVLIGSHGFLEIAAYKASASSLFKLKAGDKVIIKL